jgi:DNA-binding NarL/FixJ family response regulator
MKSKDASQKLSPAERALCTVLVVEPDVDTSSRLRACLNELGFHMISQTPSYVAALEKFQGRRYTHIIFDARSSNYPIKEWLREVLDVCPNIVAIPTSANPTADDVFELLLMGAKGFLAKPFTLETFEACMEVSTKGEPIPEVIKQVKDRNEALLAMVMTSLDNFASVCRYLDRFESASAQLPEAKEAFRRASQMAQTFAKGGEKALLGAIENTFVERSQAPATRLGRLRKRLADARDKESDKRDDSAPSLATPHGAIR